MNIEIEDDGEQTDLIPAENIPAVQDKNDMLMMKVIDTGNVEALERFIALREREESRQASLEFDRHFAEMQAEFVPVIKSKEATDSDDKKMYAFAPIEVLQKEYGPIIARHGFSYRWKEEAIETGKKCTLIISGHGSSRENSFDVPMIQGTKRMNPVQVAGAMSTYGRRYSFISGFGVIIEDEDADGILPQPQAPQGDAKEEWKNIWLTKIQDSKIEDDGHRASLEKMVNDAVKSGNHDQAKKAMDEIKKAINGN